ncbi:MAG: threonine--tRNA ligase [Methanomicrobia archaeon]|nr:threonine--tRNA ligase [Methanomicrobia archaeon]
MKIILENNQEIVVEDGKNGKDLALHFPELVKKPLAYILDGQVFDLLRPLPHGGNFRLITEDDKEALDLLRHSSSHLLAEAIQHLYPGVHFGFGPSIEDGFYYDIDFKDYAISEDDFGKIEAEMKKISKANERIIRSEVSKAEALELFKDNPYKIELITDIDSQISVYRQGDFLDLCSGPHLPSTGYIKHFKLLSLAGAYWRGDSKNKQLVRIYGTSFYQEDDLKAHLNNLEERKKRDHRKLGRELGLFMVSEYGPGFPFWLPNGLTLRKTLENWWYDLHTREGYVFVQTPIMLSKELWEVSGHWFNYKENMYTSTIDDAEFAIKPMNCPGGMLVYKNSLHSYKDLPIRMGELGLVHRHEASGALNGLFRVRTFTQDDAHVFCRPDQLIDEIGRLLKLFDRVYSVFGLDYHIELSTRPESKYIGDIATWDRSEKALAEACEKTGKVFKINPGDGAFYGPKLDFKLRDSMNRIWQCGTIQLDMNLPERFDLTYIDQNNEKVRPIMLHRAVFGSIERFIGILTEHFAGAFPTWLAPVQLNILPVNNQYHLDFAHELISLLQDEKFRVTLDDSEEKLGYRLRQSQVKKIPYTLVIGDQEVANKTVTYRKYGTSEQITVSIDDFIKLVHQEIKSLALLKAA